MLSDISPILKYGIFFSWNAAGSPRRRNFSRSIPEVPFGEKAAKYMTNFYADHYAYGLATSSGHLCETAQPKHPRSAFRGESSKVHDKFLRRSLCVWPGHIQRASLWNSTFIRRCC